MSTSDVNTAQKQPDGGLAGAPGFGLIGALSLAATGGIEGALAFYAFRAIDLALFPNRGAFVMTAVSSQLPVVLTVVGFLCGAIGTAWFRGRRHNRDNPDASLPALLRNAFVGTACGVLIGGMSGLALGRAQSQEPSTLFGTYFAGVALGFLLGLVASLVLSSRRKSSIA